MNDPQTTFNQYTSMQNQQIYNQTDANSIINTNQNGGKHQNTQFVNEQDDNQDITLQREVLSQQNQIKQSLQETQMFHLDDTFQIQQTQYNIRQQVKQQKQDKFLNKSLKQFTLQQIQEQLQQFIFCIDDQYLINNICKQIKQQTNILLNKQVNITINTTQSKPLSDDDKIVIQYLQRDINIKLGNNAQQLAQQQVSYENYNTTAKIVINLGEKLNTPQLIKLLKCNHAFYRQIIQLTNDEEDIFNYLILQCQQLQQTVNFCFTDNITVYIITKLYTIMFYEHPEFIFIVEPSQLQLQLEQENVISLQLYLKQSHQQILQQLEQCNEKVQIITSQLDKIQVDYEKEMEIYKYLTTRCNIIQKVDEQNVSVHTTLINKLCSPLTLSKTMQLLCMNMNIPCSIVEVEVSGLPHYINCIQLQQDFYYLDAYSDLQINKNSYTFFNFQLNYFDNQQYKLANNQFAQQIMFETKHTNKNYFYITDKYVSQLKQNPIEQQFIQILNKQVISELQQFSLHVDKQQEMEYLYNGKIFLKGLFLASYQTKKNIIIKQIQHHSLINQILLLQLDFQKNSKFGVFCTDDLNYILALTKFVYSLKHNEICNVLIISQQVFNYQEYFSEFLAQQQVYIKYKLVSYIESDKTYYLLKLFSVNIPKLCTQLPSNQSQVQFDVVYIIQSKLDRKLQQYIKDNLALNYQAKILKGGYLLLKLLNSKDYKTHLDLIKQQLECVATKNQHDKQQKNQNLQDDKQLINQLFKVDNVINFDDDQFVQKLSQKVQQIINKEITQEIKLVKEQPFQKEDFQILYSYLYDANLMQNRFLQIKEFPYSAQNDNKQIIFSLQIGTEIVQQYKIFQINNNSFKYYQQQIKETRLIKVLENLISCASRFQPCYLNQCQDSTTVDEIEALLDIMRLDYPELWFLHHASYQTLNSKITQVKFTTSYTREEVVQYNQQLLQFQQQFLNQCIQDQIIQQQDSLKELYIYKYIVSNTKYINTTEDSKDIKLLQNQIGCLLQKQGICSGISKTFKYLGDLLCIKAICVIGSLGNLKHQWNVVLLEEQQLYHCDLTLDIQRKNNQFLYFNLNDNMLFDVNQNDRKMECVGENIGIRKIQCQGNNYSYEYVKNLQLK